MVIGLALLVVGAGLTVLAGWLLDRPALRAPFATVPMMPVLAAALVAAALSIILRAWGDRLPVLGRGLAGLVCLLGLASVLATLLSDGRSLWGVPPLVGLGLFLLGVASSACIHSTC